MLPGDWRVDALCMEADRRRMELGIHQYSYGKLMADTTGEEREEIYGQYLQNRGRKGSRRREKLTEGLLDMGDHSIGGGHHVGGGKTRFGTRCH